MLKFQQCSGRSGTETQRKESVIISAALRSPRLYFFVILRDLCVFVVVVAFPLSLSGVLLKILHSHTSKLPHGLRACPRAALRPQRLSHVVL